MQKKTGTLKIAVLITECSFFFFSRINSKTNLKNKLASLIIPARTCCSLKVKMSSHKMCLDVRTVSLRLLMVSRGLMMEQAVCLDGGDSFSWVK